MYTIFKDVYTRSCVKLVYISYKSHYFNLVLGISLINDS